MYEIGFETGSVTENRLSRIRTLYRDLEFFETTRRKCQGCTELRLQLFPHVGVPKFAMVSRSLSDERSYSSEVCVAQECVPNCPSTACRTGGTFTSDTGLDGVV